MHLAAAGGQLEMMKFLYPKCKDKIHAKDVYGYTVLHKAAQAGKCAVAQYLIEGLNLNPQDRDKVCVCVCMC